MEDALIVVEKLDVAVVFTEDGMGNLLEQIEKRAMSFVPDISTDQGRKDLKSLAHKVARSKTIIDDLGKDMVDDWKKKAKVIDGYRKEARDFLDELKDKVRKPLTEWEEEQKAIEQEKARKELIKNQERVDNLQKYGVVLPYMEVSLMEDEEFDAVFTKAKAEFEEKEGLRLKEEARLADLQAELDRKAKEQEEKEAELKAKQEAFEKEKREAEEAKNRAEFEAKAKEEARLLAEKELKEKLEREAEERDALEQIRKDAAIREEALRPDREKLLALADRIRWIEPPDVVSDEAIIESRNALASIHSVADTLTKRAEAMK